ncbi:MAG: hypothetical protein LBR55_04215 [Bacteroidales bacterium]|jgi:predicted nuclease with TOPRIM domain|nr:hypothetical protein [Bacteroidales bacterium]
MIETIAAVAKEAIASEVTELGKEVAGEIKGNIDLKEISTLNSEKLNQLANKSEVSFTGKREDLQRKISDLKSKKAYEAKEAARLFDSNNVSDQGNAKKHAERVKTLESEINLLQREVDRLPKK